MWKETCHAHTYLTSRASATTPATMGGATEVPVCLSVHPPFKSAVTLTTKRKKKIIIIKFKMNLNYWVTFFG